MSNIHINKTKLASMMYAAVILIILFVFLNSNGSGKSQFQKIFTVENLRPASVLYFSPKTDILLKMNNKILNNYQ